MKPARKNQSQSFTVTGTFTRKEAGRKISEGHRHIHACPSTEIVASQGETPTYAWETNKEIRRARISSSNSRYEIIPAIATGLNLKHKRRLRERIEAVLEELITNAIYHAYLHSGGGEKYERKNSIELENNEVVELRYFANDNGYFVSITDCGGSIRFSDLEKSFGRCYGSGSYSQIESKESGAGLGLYLIFEAVTHLKIVCKKGVSTTISCWFSDESPSKQEEFSFNFFEEE